MSEFIDPPAESPCLFHVHTLTQWVKGRGYTRRLSIITHIGKGRNGNSVLILDCSEGNALALLARCVVGKRGPMEFVLNTSCEVAGRVFSHNEKAKGHIASGYEHDLDVANAIRAMVDLPGMTEQEWEASSRR